MTSFTVSWAGTPPSSANADNVIRAIQAAANAWASRIQGLGSIEIGVEVDPPDGNTIATGGTGFTQPNGLYVANTVSEIRTGIDPNGAAPDINVAVSAAYIDQLFYDATSTQPVPANAVDAVSVFTHEIGHGLGILSLAPSAYTNAVTTLNGRTVFTGTNAQIAGTGPVPVLSDSAHVDLPDLMNATASNGRREAISDIDLGILQDLGLPIGTNRADSVALDVADDAFFAYGGNDTVFGGAGHDTLFGNQGSDLLFGNQGNDALYGGQDADSLQGGQGDDQLFGNLGADVVLGNLGADTLFGGQGSDTLFGGQGDDVLSGDLGDDLLSGDLGADRYVFGANSGNDRVLGFSQADGDRLVLGGQGYTLGSAADGSALLTLSGGGTVALAGVTAAQFSAGFLA